MTAHIAGRAPGIRDARSIGPAIVILVVIGATIAGAFAFQAAGYAPCELCLKERWPYYAGVVPAVFAMILVARHARSAARIAFALLALLFVGSALFGAYHAGVEWGFWPGPTDCTGAMTRAASPADFMKQLETVRVVRCDAVAIRILGLSLAGWNAIVSLALVATAVVGMRRA